MRSSVGLCIDARVFPTNALFAMQQQELKGGASPLSIAIVLRSQFAVPAKIVAIKSFPCLL